MSLLRKVTDFARSPAGRRAMRDARERLDTPDNRERLSALLNRTRNRGGGRDTGQGGRR